MNQKHKGAFGSARRQIFKFGPATVATPRSQTIYIYIYIIYVNMNEYAIYMNIYIYKIFGLYHGMSQSRDGL